jgi:hypothetical protein
VADQVTLVLLVPVTVAVNCWVPPVARDADLGDTEITTGAETVTVAEADWVVSAALVAVTVYDPAVEGALYNPVEEIVPPVADQVTALFVLPVTVALNCCEAPVRSDTEVGEIATASGAVTTTAAEPDLVVSAMLVAVTT